MKPLVRFYRINKWLVKLIIICGFLFYFNPLNFQNYETHVLYFTPLAIFSFIRFLTDEKLINV